MDDFLEFVKGYINDLSEVGLNLEPGDFQYRGFGSQGDGLSFDFKLSGVKDCNKFLKLLEIENDMHLYEIEDINIFTFKNSFATHYCHEKTRNIAVEITTEDDVSSLTESLENTIESWYYSKCLEFYKIFENHHNEVIDLNKEEEDDSIEEEREEWEDDSEGDGVDIESVIVNRIDHNMDIEKIISMIEESDQVSNSIQEKDELIKKFINNFKKDYIIIKRVD